ncbi:MAG: hypothetical protein IKF91_04235 [Bacilli bacterium]|nr:hypothetical protein [Bacilli bacterium]
MYSKEGIISLIKEILDEKPFTEMTYENIVRNIDLVEERLNELKAEYAYRVHMENGMIEHPDELLDSIKILKKVYTMLLKRKEKKEKERNNNKKELKVKNLDKTEENQEKNDLNIPQKIILVPEEETETEMIPKIIYKKR